MTIEDGLRPLLTSMKLFGLYCSRQPDDADDSVDEKSRRWNMGAIYGAAVVTLLWINAVRMLSVFTNEEEFCIVLFAKLILVTWSTQCAIAQTAFYWASFSGRLAVVFCQPLSDSCAKHAQKFSTIYSVVAWSVIMLGSSFIAYGLFFTDGYYQCNWLTEKCPACSLYRWH